MMEFIGKGSLVFENSIEKTLNQKWFIVVLLINRKI